MQVTGAAKGSVHRGRRATMHGSQACSSRTRRSVMLAHDSSDASVRRRASNGVWGAYLRARSESCLAFASWIGF